MYFCDDNFAKYNIYIYCNVGRDFLMRDTAQQQRWYVNKRKPGLATKVKGKNFFLSKKDAKICLSNLV